MALFFFLLMAGEIYTTFTFLGEAAGRSKGAPTFYILGYGALAYLLSYFYCHPFGSMRKSITLFHSQIFCEEI